jgi:hypothetical protein
VLDTLKEDIGAGRDRSEGVGGRCAVKIVTKIDSSAMLHLSMSVPLNLINSSTDK